FRVEGESATATWPSFVATSPVNHGYHPASHGRYQAKSKIGAATWPRRVTSPMTLLRNAAKPSATANNSEHQKSLGITSPSLRVIRSRKVVGLIAAEMNRTEPSQSAALKPATDRKPSFGTGLAASNGKSSGLVQGTEVAASTSMIVFEVPSVKSAMR